MILPLLTALGLGVFAAGLFALIFYRLDALGRRRLLDLHLYGLERIQRLRVPLPALAAGALVFAACMYLFKNPAPAAFGAALCALLPGYLSYWRQARHREAVLNQLAAAVRLFAAEFTVSSQLGKCLAVVGQRIPDPVGSIFKRACFKLAYGNDANAVFRQMEEELNSPYGGMFVQIIRAAHEKGHSVAPLLHDLVSRITVAQELARSNRSEISGERWVGLLFAVLPLPLYFLLQAWIPEAGIFLTGTAAGRAVVFASFLSAIAWFYVDRVVNET